MSSSNYENPREIEVGEICFYARTIPASKAYVEKRITETDIFIQAAHSFSSAKQNGVNILTA